MRMCYPLGMLCENMAVTRRYSCSWHGVAAGRLTSERPDGVVPLSKTLTVPSAFVGSATAEVFEAD